MESICQAQNMHVMTLFSVSPLCGVQSLPLCAISLRNLQTALLPDTSTTRYVDATFRHLLRVSF